MSALLELPFGQQCLIYLAVATTLIGPFWSVFRTSAEHNRINTWPNFWMMTVMVAAFPVTIVIWITYRLTNWWVKG